MNLSWQLGLRLVQAMEAGVAEVDYCAVLPDHYTPEESLAVAVV